MAPATGTTSVASTGTSVAPFAITTTWTAPTQCAQSVGGLTMLEVDQYRVWLNAILPVPGSTVTSCYPSQYISSFLLQTGGVSQAAMSPLVCPAGYTTQGPFTSNYIACCPSGWDGLALASSAPSDRPAFGGTCYTNIYNVPISVSFYDNSAFKATSIFTATDSAAQAFASPYEGFALGVAVVQSTTSSGSSATPTATSSTSSSSVIVTASGTPASSQSSHKISGGAIAGIVIGVLAGLALAALAAFFILRHRRRNLNGSQASEREFQYGGQPDHDPNAPNAGYYNSEPKKDVPPPAEVYGSQDVKNHGEPQELGAQNYVHELGDGQTHDAGRNLSERDKKLPNLPSPASPSPVSPEYR